MQIRSLLGVARKTWRRPVIKRSLVIIVILLTAGLFVQFFVRHPAYFHQLAHISPWTIIWIVVLNTMMLIVLTLMGLVTIALCGRQIGLKENFLLTAYSSIANFFGPLQSGPGVRAAYLKTRHQVRLRDYTLASLIGLGFFAFFSALFLLVGTRAWWQTTIVLLMVGVFSSFVIWLFQRKDRRPAESHFAFRPKLIVTLLILAFVQTCITVGWYYVELKAVNPQVHFSQAMSYAGAANFALFVSVTPDAIGIREAFLLFSQHIHHVPTYSIVSANVIDRAAYVLFLAILFVIVISLHAKTKLQLTSSKGTASTTER